MTQLAAKSQLHSSSHSHWNCLLSDLCRQQCNGRATNPACQGIIIAVAMCLSVSCLRTCLLLPILLQLQLGWTFSPEDAMSEVEGSSTGAIWRGEGTEELIVCTATLPKNKKRSYHSVSYRALCIQTSLNEGLLHALHTAIQMIVYHYLKLNWVCSTYPALQFVTGTVSLAHSHNECGYEVNAKEDKHPQGYLSLPFSVIPCIIS